MPIENLLRSLSPQVLGALLRRYTDFSTAEDAVQEALLAAYLQWPLHGVPKNPKGWLIQVANRKMIDAIRSESARSNREATPATDDELEAPVVTGDDEHIEAVLSVL